MKNLPYTILKSKCFCFSSHDSFKSKLNFINTKFKPRFRKITWKMGPVYWVHTQKFAHTQMSGNDWPSVISVSLWIFLYIQSKATKSCTYSRLKGNTCIITHVIHYFHMNARSSIRICSSTLLDLSLFCLMYGFFMKYQLYKPWLSSWVSTCLDKLLPVLSHRHTFSRSLYNFPSYMATYWEKVDNFCRNFFLQSYTRFFSMNLMQQNATQCKWFLETYLTWKCLDNLSNWVESNLYFKGPLTLSFDQMTPKYSRDHLLYKSYPMKLGVTWTKILKANQFELSSVTFVRMTP